MILVRRMSYEFDQARSEALCELRLLSKGDPTAASSSPTPAAYHSSSSLFTPRRRAAPAQAPLRRRTPWPPSSTSPSPTGIPSCPPRPSSTPSLTSSAAETAVATVHSLLVVDTYRPIIGAKRQLLSPLLRLIQLPNSPARSVKDALTALFGVALFPLNRPSLIDLGAVPPLFHLVLKDSRTCVVEDATAVIAQMAGCVESVDAFRKVSGVDVLVDLLDTTTGSTMRVRESAVAALLNLMQLGREEVEELGRGRSRMGIEEVAKSGSAKRR